MNPPPIPLAFKTAEPALGSDLGRLSSGIVNWARALPDPSNSVPGVANITARVLAFGQLMRVAPQDGEVVALVLPPLDTRQGGRAIRIARMNTLGSVFIAAPSRGAVDGVGEILLYASVRVTTIWYDGAFDYISDGSAVDVGAGL